MDTVRNVIARELRARESLREWMMRHKPFERDEHAHLSQRHNLVQVGHMLPKQIPLGLQLGVDTRLVPIIGMPGKGKTHWMRMLSLQMMHQGYKVKVVSRKVHEFRDLVAVREDLFDLEPGDFTLNPFISPVNTIPQKRWNEVITSTFQSDAWLKYYSGTNLAKILDDFCVQTPGRVITPSRLISFIDSDKRKNFKKLDLDEKVRSRLESLLTGEGRNIFEGSENIAFEFFAESNINFNLSSLNSNQLLLFVAFFIAMLVHYKRETRSKTRDCVILDDYGEMIAELKTQ